MSSKRPLGPPSGNTPNKPPKKSARRRSGTPRKSLVFNDDPSKDESSGTATTCNASWDEKEMSALVQFIALYHEGDESHVWPTHKRQDFWERCAGAVSKYSCLPHSCPSWQQRIIAKMPKYVAISLLLLVLLFKTLLHLGPLPPIQCPTLANFDCDYVYMCSLTIDDNLWIMYLEAEL